MCLLTRCQTVFILWCSSGKNFIDGELLCKYILDHGAKLRETDKENTFFLIIPKTDLAKLAGDNNNIIKYNKAVANLFAAGRDESMYMNLT